MRKIEELAEYMWPIIYDSEHFPSFEKADKISRTRLINHIGALLPLLERQDKDIEYLQDRIYRFILILNWMVAEKYDGKSLIEISDIICNRLEIKNPLV